MNPGKLAPALTLILLALAGLALGKSAQAADPYFAPYGAHRGRIHIGPRHARIRWGGGITQYGAAVLIHGFDVAGTVLTGSGVGAIGGDGSGSVGNESASESNKAECEQQLQRTRELLEETRRVCSLKSSEASPDPAGPPAKPRTLPLKPVAPR